MILNVVPVAKGRPRMGRYGAYTPDKTRKAEEEIRWLMREQYRGEPATGPISLSVTFYTPIPASLSKKRREALVGAYNTSRNGDLDNLVKTVSDSGNDLLWLDDAQIVSLTAKKIYSKTPHIELQVNSL